MGKSSKSEQEVTRYFQSIHFGWCSGADSLNRIFIGEKQFMSFKATDLAAIPLSSENLFGGDKKEGGASGIVWYLPGKPDQVFPAALASRRGLTPDTHPAYRGVTTIYFTGNTTTGGFYWGTTPFVQEVWAEFTRAPKGLDPTYALIANPVTVSVTANFTAGTYSATIGSTTVPLTLGHATFVAGSSVQIDRNVSQNNITVTIDGLVVVWDNDGPDINGDPKPVVTVDSDMQPLRPGLMNFGGVQVSVDITSSGAIYTVQRGYGNGADANPAHIIYEVLTDKVQGMGATDVTVDRSNMEDVAKVLFNEAFGLSILWTKQTTHEDFIGEVLDHIQGALYLSPDTGKLTLKLFRDDYDETTLRVITPDNAVLDNFQRKLWGETVNEMVVTWCNPANEGDETVTVQDLANITNQSGVVSDNRNFYGVRSAALALRLADRELRQSSAPLASAEALLDRSEWDLKPGDVVAMTWPEYGITSPLVMRVMKIDYGKIGTPSIVVTLLEDIFSLERGGIGTAIGSAWPDPSSDPTPLNHVNVITAPSYFTRRRLSAADLEQLVYPEVLAAVLPASTNTDAVLYELLGQTVLPNAVTASEELGTKGLLGYVTLAADMTEEAETVIADFGDISGGIGPLVAGFVFIGNAAGETGQEIALIDSFADGVGWTLKRGTLDTVPRAWPAGTGLWFYDQRNDFFDGTVHSAGEAVSYKMLTITSKGRLSIDDAPVIGATMTGRPHLPTRPANVQVSSVAFGPVDLSSSPPSSIDCTWANRNRLMEDGPVVLWTDGNVTPETGQTTTIRMCKTDGTVMHTYSGLTGTSYSVPTSDHGSEAVIELRFSSVRDGLESLQYTARRVRVSGSGSAGDPSNPTPPPYTPPSDFPPIQKPPPTCPTIDTLIRLANATHDGPGAAVRADALVPGVSYVWTQHEDTMEWGAYRVVKASVVPNAEVWYAPGYPRTTASHPFWIDGRWVEMGTIGTPDGRGSVVWITVDQAHTFVTVGANGSETLSHNKVAREPDF